MANVWIADEGVMNTVRDLVANYHPHLAALDKEILVLFKEKSAKSGDVVVPGTASKASPMLGVVSEVQWKFILTIGQDEWQTYTDPERIALLDHLLCACRAVEDEDTHEIKCSVAKPDVTFYADEIARHGYWRAKGSPKQDNLILELFGADASKVP